MLVVDTHTHVFSPDESRYPPRPDPDRPPEGVGTLERLRQTLRDSGVRGACVVQVSGFYAFDNRYVLDVTKANQDWAAGCVTLSPDDPGAPAKLAGYVRDYGIRGMRSVPASDGQLDHDGVRALWRSSYEHSVAINLLIGDALASQAERLLGELPELPVILDHCLQLEAGSDVRAKLAALRRLARFSNCHAKLSFIGNGPQGCQGGFPCKDFQPVVLEVIEIFGPERCAWGGHFPLEKYSPRLTHAEHLAIYQNELGLDGDAKRWVLGETANRMYFGGKLS